jgi:hypothetical protein
MRSWLLAAGLLAAVAASPAQAADLDGDDEAPPPRSWPHSGLQGGPYTNPRYGQPVPPPAYRDDDDDDNDNDRYSAVPPPRTYSHAPPRYAPPPATKTCVRSEQVRERLTGEGWRDFHDGKPASEGFVTMRARRANGRLFELTLHRCSGEVVEARPLELRPFGPYAYRQPYSPYGPWRWGQQRAPYAQDDDSWEERSYAYRGPRRWHNGD